MARRIVMPNGAVVRLEEREPMDKFRSVSPPKEVDYALLGSVRPLTYSTGQISFSYPAEITDEQIAQLQTKAGYMPLGYGCFNIVRRPGLTTWSCWNNCD
jgi:hypothetical protein